MLVARPFLSTYSYFRRAHVVVTGSQGQLPAMQVGKHAGVGVVLLGWGSVAGWGFVVGLSFVVGGL